MTRYKATLSASFARPVADPVYRTDIAQHIIGVTQGGYFWSHEYGWREYVVRNVTDPTTEIDRTATESSLVDPSDFAAYGHHGTGEYVWALKYDITSLSPLTYNPNKVAKFDLVAGSIVQTTVGVLPSFLTPAGSGTSGSTYYTPHVMFMPHDSNDYCLIMSIRNDNSDYRRVTVVDLSTMTALHDYTFDTPTHDRWTIGWPSTNRQVALCSTHDELELIEISTGTVLDTYPADPGRWALYGHTCAPNEFIYTDSTGVADSNYVRRMSVAGDTFSVMWETTVTENWSNGIRKGASLSGTMLSDWVILSTWIQGNDISGYPTYAPLRLAIIDKATGRVSKTPSDVLLGMGADGWWVDNAAVAAGLGYFVTTADDDDTNMWSTWLVTPTADATLRQRQSPRRSPSRVGYPTLRNRQTPYIR